MLSSRKERQRSRVFALAGPVIQPGDRVLVDLSCVAGPSLWLRTGLVSVVIAVAIAVSAPFNAGLGALGGALIGLAVSSLLYPFYRYYHLVLTEQGLIVVAASYWTGRPTTVAFTEPRANARFFDFHQGTTWSWFRLATPAAPEPWRMNVSRRWEGELDQLKAITGNAAMPGQATPGS